jgi:hypothetical protein
MASLTAQGWKQGEEANFNVVLSDTWVDLMRISAFLHNYAEAHNSA